MNKNKFYLWLAKVDADNERDSNTNAEDPETEDDNT